MIRPRLQMPLVVEGSNLTKDMTRDGWGGAMKWMDLFPSHRGGVSVSSSAHMHRRVPVVCIPDIFGTHVGLSHFRSSLASFLPSFRDNELVSVRDTAGDGAGRGRRRGSKGMNRSFRPRWVWFPWSLSGRTHTILSYPFPFITLILIPTLICAVC
jgi:hypothetical protein